MVWKKGIRRSEIIQELHKNSRSPDLRYEMGMNLQETGREDDASDWFLMALADDPDHVPSQEALADYFMRRAQKVKGENERQEYLKSAEEYRLKAEQSRKKKEAAQAKVSKDSKK
jgi:hypothetical protein